MFRRRTYDTRHDNFILRIIGRRVVRFLRVIRFIRFIGFIRIYVLGIEWYRCRRR